MGQGAADSEGLVNLVRSQAKSVVLFDMEETAERNHSVISSVMLGALCGAGVLPFRKSNFQETIKKSGIAVAANLAAFEDAYQRAQRGDSGFTGKAVSKLSAGDTIAGASARLQPLLDRISGYLRWFSLSCWKAPAGRWTTRIRSTLSSISTASSVAALEARLWADASSYALLEAMARSLALWMTFEDTIRVADLKTRGSRFRGCKEEIQADPGPVVRYHGVHEAAGRGDCWHDAAGPRPLGVGSPGVSGWLSKHTAGRQIKTRTLSGFLLLYLLAASSGGGVGRCGFTRRMRASKRGSRGSRASPRTTTSSQCSWPRRSAW